MNEICRTCLSDNGKKMNIFTEVINESVISFDAMIMEVASVQVIKDDGYSSLICEICIRSLNEAFLFRQKCRKADQFIRQCNVDRQLKTEFDSYDSENENQVHSPIRTEHEFDLDSKTDIAHDIHIDRTNIEDDPCNNKFDKHIPIDENNKKLTSKKKIENKQICQLEKPIKDLIKENHMFAVNEKGEKEFHCFVCKSIHKKRSDFIEHTRTHNMKSPFICRKCGKCHSNSTALKMHYNHHTTGQPYCCEICGKRYFRSGDLKVHMRNHTGEKPFKCSQCDKSFRRPHILAKHFQTHSGIKLYTCKICGKKLTNLDYHMRMHRNDRRFECHMCGKTFIKRSHLTTHMVVHTGDKKHVCTVCGKAFGWISNLHQHSLIHSGKQSHVCDVCGQSFMHKHAMQSHMKKHDTGSG